RPQEAGSAHGTPLLTFQGGRAGPGDHRAVPPAQRGDEPGAPADPRAPEPLPRSVAAALPPPARLRGRRGPFEGGRPMSRRAGAERPARRRGPGAALLLAPAASLLLAAVALSGCGRRSDSPAAETAAA